MPRRHVSPERLRELAAECAATRAQLGTNPPASAATKVAETLWFENVIAEAEGRGVQLGAASLFEFYEVVDRGWIPGTWLVFEVAPAS